MLRQGTREEGERLYGRLQAAWRKLLLARYPDWKMLAAIHQRLQRLEELGIGPEENQGS